MSEILDSLRKELERLEEASDILMDIWCHNSPYKNEWKISPENMDRMRRLYGFDDSE